MISTSSALSLLVLATAMSVSHAYSIPTRSTLRSLGSKTISSSTTKYTEKSTMTMEGTDITYVSLVVDFLSSVDVRHSKGSQSLLSLAQLRWCHVCDDSNLSFVLDFSHSFIQSVTIKIIIIIIAKILVSWKARNFHSMIPGTALKSLVKRH